MTAGRPLADNQSMRSKAGRFLVGALFVMLAGSSSAPRASQSAPPVDPLAPLDFLIGRWEGTTEGEPGRGTVQREYTRVLGSRFVHLTNRSVYPPQEKNPKGETHDDLGYFSFDKARKRIVFRQFHVEGFVVHYVHEPSSAAGGVVFVSEAIENIPTGWRSRETYRAIAPDEVEEVFEMAGPGKEFAVYSRSRLKKVK